MTTAEHKCAGRSLLGPDHRPDYYITPPLEVCSNLRTDGPTPCWFPHCVTDEQLSSIIDSTLREEEKE